jgi:hypothetical protein
MSVLLLIAPPRIGRVKVVRAYEPQHAYNRKRTCNSSADGQDPVVFSSSEPVHDVTLHERVTMCYQGLANGRDS